MSERLFALSNISHLVVPGECERIEALTASTITFYFLSSNKMKVRFDRGAYRVSSNDGSID